jgi:hypothetical protein
MLHMSIDTLNGAILSYLFCAHEVRKTRAPLGYDVTNNFCQVAGHVLNIERWVPIRLVTQGRYGQRLGQERGLAERIEEVKDVYTVIDRSLLAMSQS